MVGSIGGARVSLAGIMTSLGGGTNNLVTITRPGNIALLSAGNQGLGTVVGVRTPLQQQQHQQQHMNASSSIVNSGGTAMLSVSTSNGGATVTRLVPLASSGVNAISLSAAAAAAGMMINVAQNQSGQAGSVLTSNGTHLAPTLTVMQRTATPQRFTAVSLQQHAVGGETNAGGAAMANASQLGLSVAGIASAANMGARVSHP